MLVLLALAAGLALAGQARPTESITVSAAVSLTEALQSIAKVYADAGGGRLSFNFAGSNVLSRQIVNGAPVDVFISADTAQMAVVEKASLVAPGSLVNLLGNQLAIVVHRDRAGEVDIAALPRMQRVAVGDPDAVPAGVYAKQYLERVGLWNTLQPRILPTASVRAALAAVENGSAEAGIVYVTDARSSRDVRVTAVIAGPEAPTIVYPACIVAASRRKDAAAAFLSFLQTPAAGEIFRKQGFQTLAKPKS